MLDEAEHPIWLDTGAEPIAGSTRMKAGTAQRVALTMLSSLVMIRLGHVYEGLMVDVQATNSKLVRRSEKMLAQLTGRSRERGARSAASARGSVKLALLLLQGNGLDEARHALKRADGQVRVAMQLLGKAYEPGELEPDEDEPLGPSPEGRRGQEAVSGS